MNPQLEQLQHLTRRHFLRDSTAGLGGIALASLLAKEAAAAPQVNPLAPEVAAFAAQGEAGDLSAHDRRAAAPRPVRLQAELVKLDGQDCPESFLKGKRFAFTSGTPKLLGTPRTFTQHGKGGIWLSDALPHLHSVADEMCVIKSMNTDQFNHAPAELLLYTGSPRSGRPSMGSWVTYGLGTENENLPGFVVLISSGVQPNGGKNSCGSGFLPSVFQGVQCRSQGRSGAVCLRSAGHGPRAAPQEPRRAASDLNELQAARARPSRNADPHRAVRTGVPHADAVPEVMDITKRDARKRSRPTARSRARRASPTIACSPGGWSSRACGSCSSSTGAGTSTAPGPARTFATA